MAIPQQMTESDY